MKGKFWTIFWLNKRQNTQMYKCRATKYHLAPWGVIYGKNTQTFEKEREEESNVTKSYFPCICTVYNRQTSKWHKITAIITGHGKIGEYLLQFNISDQPTWQCRKNSQTVDRFFWDYEIFQLKRDKFIRKVILSGSRWPLNKSELVKNAFKILSICLKKYINFEYLQESTLLDLTERNANHIIPLCCHLPVSFRSLVDRCGSLGSCKLQI